MTDTANPPDPTKLRLVAGTPLDPAVAGTPLDPAVAGSPFDPALIAACPFCDEQGWLWKGEVVEGRCSHVPRHRDVNVDEPGVPAALDRMTQVLDRRLSQCFDMLQAIADRLADRP
jgi:hypothetical protein